MNIYNKILFCKLSEIKEKKFIIKYIEKLRDEIIIFIDKETSKLKAFSSICPHFGGTVVYDYKTNKLSCNWHGWNFCKNSGKCLSYPIKSKIKQYDFTLSPNNLKKYNATLETEDVYILHLNE